MQLFYNSRPSQAKQTVITPSQKGSIEVLLLLSCMVGVVVFFCFALGITTLISDHPGFESKKGVGRLGANQQHLTAERTKQNESLTVLKEQLKKIKRQFLEMNPMGDQKARQKEMVEIAEEKTRNELASLDEQYNTIQLKIEAVKEEQYNQMASPERQNILNKKKWDLDSLKSDLNTLNNTIQELKDEVIKLSSTTLEEKSAPEPLINDNLLQSEENKNQRDRLEKLKEELLTQIKKEKVRVVLKGADDYENPLFVECGKDFLLFFPEEQKVWIKELDQRNVFFKKTKGHDITVLLVRPDGFDTFNRAYTLIKDMKIKNSYEPVDAIYSLDFLKGS